MTKTQTKTTLKKAAQNTLKPKKSQEQSVMIQSMLQCAEANAHGDITNQSPKVCLVK
jgi:hypothetical protein